MEELQWQAGREGREGERRGELKEAPAKWLSALWRGEAESAPFSANLQPGLGIVQDLTSRDLKGPSIEHPGGI